MSILVVFFYSLQPWYIQVQTRGRFLHYMPTQQPYQLRGIHRLLLSDRLLPLGHRFSRLCLHK